MAGTLFASVLLNLFLVGVMAGVMPGGGRHHFFAPLALTSPHGEFLLEGMTRYLDPDDASALREVAKSDGAALKEAHENAREAAKAVAAIFEQEPADPQTLQIALDKLGTARGEVDNAMKKIVQDADAKLSPEGRHRLAEVAR
jgi:uncharacterized membrane protein